MHIKDNVQNKLTSFRSNVARGLKKGLHRSKRIIVKKFPKTQAIGSQTLRINQNLTAKIRNKRDISARKHAEYLSTLPKSRWGRFFYRLHPRNIVHYWFSRRGAIMALKIAGISILFFSIVIAGVFAYYRKDLPQNITDLKACSLGQTIKFYDRTGKVLLWSGAGDVDCRPVALDQVSPYLKKAVVTAEDKNFYSHHGFDPVGLFNAAISNATTGGSGRGGSTITQQYVKLALLTPERSLTRKIKELILSVELDASYKKDEILQAYLNEIGFAYQYNGAEAASKGLFDKSAKDITLDEAAIMAAGIPAPDYYWVQNQKALVERRNYILDEMAKSGAITKDEAKKAKAIDTLAKVVKNKSQYKDIIAPHFVLEVYKQLKETYGKDVTKLGLSVTTTLDIELQKIAEEAVTNGFPCKNGLGINCLGVFDNAAFVAEDVTNGHIVAEVGSRDFNIPVYGQLNIATTPRSPGSTIKPFDYAALMLKETSWGAGSILYDVKTKFSAKYAPNDYDIREPGGISMRYALGNSRNIPAVKAMYIAGVENVHNLAKKMGVYSGVTGCDGAPNCEGILATAIGDGGQVRLDEQTHGYATFSRLGVVKPMTYILKIENSKGKILQQWQDEAGEQALNPEVAYIVNDMLADRAASYFRTNKGYRQKVTNGFETMEIPTSIKTGTTSEGKDGWMIGYTQKYAAGVWMGNHENKTSRGIDYVPATGPIFGEFMRRAHELLPEKPGAWTRPAGIKTASLDPEFYAAIKAKCTGSQVGNVCGFGISDIYPSWYSPVSSSKDKKAIIDTISGKLATECTPELAKKEVTGGNIMPEIPSSDPNYKNWLEPIAARYSGLAGIALPVDKDDKHSCSDAKPATTINVTKLGTGYYRFSANVSQGLAALTTLNFKIDGQTVSGGSFATTNPGTVSMDYFSELTGSHDVSAQAIDALLYEYTTSPVSQNFDAVPAVTVTKSGSTISWPNTASLSWIDSYQWQIKNSGGVVTNTGSGTNVNINTVIPILPPAPGYTITVDAYKNSEVVKTGTLSFSKP